MITLRVHSSSRDTAVAAALAALLLAGCALLQPPPVPSVPRLGQRAFGDAACGAEIGRAHSALAAVGAAGGDPAATAAAHAAHAAAMHEYHTCLARRGQP
ncbi:hypothetical protein J421_5382 (plasmid) [Gemmatirosa kalamazoonensis]|uniref:Lipoprotein n=1 Tax=Gemmatirosa kalamazoonensis TaxID=861299 RepID=W0RR24_9BACT|nr:hypothetical protein [Gemmatirosa kalamazoonensis]AHG92917.1 hypothetical protein J421_5382 [Gemmatirosa kalamazoonensis]